MHDDIESTVYPEKIVYVCKTQMEETRKHNYLGTKVNDRNDYNEEIKWRIGKGRNAFGSTR